MYQNLCTNLQKFVSFWGTSAPEPLNELRGSDPGPRWGTSPTDLLSFAPPLALHLGDATTMHCIY